MKRTKNYIKYKKIYLIDSSGVKYAPFRVTVEYDGYDTELDRKLEELAERNTGLETGSGFGGNRDISYDFFTEKGAKVFVKKASQRYSKKYDLEARVEEANIEYNEI